MVKNKISKGMRIQMCALAGIKTFDNSYTSISDILPKDVRPEDVELIVTNWLDENCSNGYTSRWTNFGNNIMRDADDFAQELTSIYRRFGL
jgi:hypothetical protein